MAAGLGSLADYAAAAGTAVPDVAGLAGGAGSLASLAGLSNPITLAPSIAMLGLQAAGINPLQDILSSLQGLPASTKPNMFANYLNTLGGLPADLGSLINAAQQQVGSGTGLLSMSGAGAFNPNFMATLLEALTGQNIGNVDPSTGRISFTAPATGGVSNPVSLSFLPESSLMSSSPMAGLTAYGFTPAQLSSPAALKAIEQATNYGLVGTGQNLGTQQVANYLPKVVAALESAGITPATGPGSTSQYLNQPQQADVGTTPGTQTGGTTTTTTNQNQQTTSGGGGTPLVLPLGSLSSLINTSPSTATSTSSAIANPTQNITFTQLPSASYGQSYSKLGLSPWQTISPVSPQSISSPSIGNLISAQAPQPVGVTARNIPQQPITTSPVITPQMDMSGVGGGVSGLLQLLQQLLGGGGGSTTTPSSTASVQPWTLAG